MSVQTHTVNYDDAMSAATTLLQWAEERGVGLEQVIMLKTLQEKVMSFSRILKTFNNYFEQ